MDTPIGLKELRKNVAAYAVRAQNGESFTIMRRSQPIFRLLPPDDADELWETVVDFTKFYKNGIPARQLLRKLSTIREEQR
ncbi:MAG: hypothetical protein AAB539_00235 [Patescibacteria group bacterium]